MTLKIEIGKYYRTRDGRKVGPALWRDELGGYFSLGSWHYNESGMSGLYGKPDDTRTNLHIVAEWTDEPETQPDSPKLWRDMTPEEKGALLLAHHEGKVIEIKTYSDEWAERKEPRWQDANAYRIRPPEPKRETVKMYWRKGKPSFFTRLAGDTHRITFDLVDGKPDCASIRMEEL